MANRGAQVHMLCRSEEKGLAAIKSLKAREGAKKDLMDRLVLHRVDVSSMKDIENFINRDFKSDRVDILVNNAGCMVDGRVLSADGIEVNCATNVVGPYLLTEGLIPKLKKSVDGAIVLTVTSGGMLTVKLDPVDLELSKRNPLKGIDAYAQNKRQQVEMTKYWVDKYGSDSNIFFCTAHPGWADTPAVRSSMPDFYAKMKDRLRTPEQGADTIIWAVVSKRVKTDFPNGSFFEDRRAVSDHLTGAFTKSTVEERNLFISNLQKLIDSHRK